MTILIVIVIVSCIYLAKSDAEDRLKEKGYLWTVNLITALTNSGNTRNIQNSLHELKIVYDDRPGREKDKNAACKYFLEKSGGIAAHNFLTRSSHYRRMETESETARQIMEARWYVYTMLWRLTWSKVTENVHQLVTKLIEEGICKEAVHDVHNAKEHIATSKVCINHISQIVMMCI